MIHLEGVHKSYRLAKLLIPVLKGVSFSIDEGEFTALMGPSGSGKSTLLNIIGCLDTLDSGRYHLGELAIEEASEDQLAHIRNRRLGFVFQSFNLIPRINARRNVELPLVYQGVTVTQRKERALIALERVGLADRANHSPAELSGGQQQRVAIARSMVNDPDVLIADEPTGSLDSTTGAAIMDLFCELNRSGKTVVLVTHEQEVAAYAHRVLYLRDGMIEADNRQ